MARATAAVVGVLLLTLSTSVSAQSLRGSRASMQRQNGIARDHDYSFLRTSSQVNRFVDLGLLVHLPGNDDYELAHVSYPYARPAVKRGIKVNRTSGDPANQLHERHDASDFDTKTQDKLAGAKA